MQTFLFLSTRIFVYKIGKSVAALLIFLCEFGTAFSGNISHRVMFRSAPFKYCETIRKSKIATPHIQRTKNLVRKFKRETREIKSRSVTLFVKFSTGSVFCGLCKRYRRFCHSSGPDTKSAGTRLTFISVDKQSSPLIVHTFKWHFIWKCAKVAGRIFTYGRGRKSSRSKGHPLEFNKITYIKDIGVCLGKKKNPYIFGVFAKPYYGRLGPSP